jgi:hypothetical protein
MKQQAPQKVIVFLGKLGHGKTRLVNLLCCTNFSSSMTAGSCTLKLQRGTTQKHGILVVDTPGFESSDDTFRHTEYQIKALESCELSGVFIIVKHGRLDDMASSAGLIMDFADSDDARIIVTFADFTDQTKDEDVFRDAKAQLALKLGVRMEHIMMVGTHTKAEALEAFLHSTLLPARRYHVSADFKAYANTLQVGARKAIPIMNALSEGLKSHDRAAIQLNKSRLVDLALSLTAEERRLLTARLQETFCSKRCEKVIRSILNQIERPATTCSFKRKTVPVEAAAEESTIKKHKAPQRDAIMKSMVGQSVAVTAAAPTMELSFNADQATVEPNRLHHRCTLKAVTTSSYYLDLDSFDCEKQEDADELVIGSGNHRTAQNKPRSNNIMSTSSGGGCHAMLCIASSIIIASVVGAFVSLYTL